LIGNMDLAVFALNASRGTGEKITASLAVPLASHEVREYETASTKPVHWKTCAAPSSCGIE
jgi:hypothetical protein